MDRKKALSKIVILTAGVVMLVAIVKISSVAADFCRADLNDDGRVDFQDIEIMKAETGRENCFTETCQADLNGDGKVDDIDWKIIKNEFGRDDCLSDNSDTPGDERDIPQPEKDTAFDAGENENAEEEITLPATRFKDNGDGTVSDPQTGLIWTRDANLPGDTMLFHQALDYIEGMNEGNYPNFGYTDWRLPTIKELQSLIDYTNYTDMGHILPAGHPFKNVQLLRFNESQSVTYLSNSDFPLFVSLYCRLVGHNVKSCYGYVWPVRGGQEISE